MKADKIYWKDAIEIIKNKKSILQEQIDYKDEKISIKDVLFLNENGFRVPKDLVEYDDDNLDYSENQAISEEDITSGKLERIYTTEIPIKEEVAQWLTKSNIKLDDLVVKLIDNFYQTTKHIQNKQHYNMK